MSPPNLVREPNFNKTDIHPTSMSSNSEPYEPHVPMCDYPSTDVNMYDTVDPEQDIARPDESGGDLF